MRVPALIGVLVLSLAVAGGSASAETPRSALYLVRPDLRLCPSPLCGGAWVRRVNHTLTQCVGGARRNECYVASVEGSLTKSRGGYALVRGWLMAAPVEGFPNLAKLVATAAWMPATAQPARGTVYRVADNGIRCITNPCFSLTASAPETTRKRTFSSIDLSRVGAATDLVRRAEKALDGGGLYVAGSVVADDGPAGEGRMLVATQFWLRV